MSSRPSRAATIANSAAPSQTGNIRHPLSPASLTNQLYAESRRLPRCARAERRAHLLLELSALAAADAIEGDEEVEEAEEEAEEVEKEVDDLEAEEEEVYHKA